ncbi:MAG TPA: hypothetical protein VEI54_03265 [Candidatus Limnocylindrales bacterium]|nr:hypothetical protein [Candidatus Limnocylindrales bacterium]
MWLVKGILVGLGVFILGSLVYVGYHLRPIEPEKATGLSAITALTLYDYRWWVALVATVALACWYFQKK